MSVTLNPSNGRGCGFRTEDSVYFCCGLSPYGKPIEDFVLDPVIPWVGGWSRGMKILPRGDGSGINDLVIFVGRGVSSDQELYPFYWDFIEEARLYGVSRKGHKNLPFHKLTPGESYMLFVHAKAIPEFAFEVFNPWSEPALGCKNPAMLDEGHLGSLPERHNYTETICSFATKDLALFTRHNYKATNDKNLYKIEGPSYYYECAYPIVPDPAIKNIEELPWKPGIFLMLPLTHIEAKNRLDSKTTEKINRAGYQVEVLDY